MTILSSNDYFLNGGHKRLSLSCFIDALTNTEKVRLLHAERDQFRHTATCEAFLILKASQLEFRLEPFLADGIAETTQSLGLGIHAVDLTGVFKLLSIANIWPQIVQSSGKIEYDEIAAGGHYAFILEPRTSLPLPDSLIAFRESEDVRGPGGAARRRLHTFVPTATLRYAIEVDVSEWKTPGLAANKAALEASIAAAAAKTREIFAAYLVLKDVVAWLNQIRTYQELIEGFPAAASIDQLKPKTSEKTAPAAPTMLKTL